MLSNVSMVPSLGNKATSRTPNSYEINFVPVPGPECSTVEPEPPLLLIALHMSADVTRNVVFLLGSESSIVPIVIGDRGTSFPRDMFTPWRYNQPAVDNSNRLFPWIAHSQAVNHSCLGVLPGFPRFQWRVTELGRCPDSGKLDLSSVEIMRKERSMYLINPYYSPDKRNLRLRNLANKTFQSECATTKRPRNGVTSS